MDVQKTLAKLGVRPDVALALHTTAQRYKIVHTDHWIAQMMVESDNFTKTKENLHYRPEILLETFKGRNGITSLEQCKAILARGYNATAEAIYGLPWGGRPGKLGNTEPGDGAKFPGRGYKQLTGRDNYTRYSMDTYGDLRCVANPERLERLPDAALSCGWFWQKNKIDAIAATDRVADVRAKVNGGLNGLTAARNNLLKVRRLQVV